MKLTASSTIRGQRPSLVRRSSPTAAPRAARRASVFVRADISASSALAISQQAIAYAVAVAGENLYQRSLLVEGASGRPALPLTVAGAASAAAAAALVGGSSGSGPAATLGLAVGFIGAAVTMVVSGKRAVDVKGDPFAWPGPRAWPVFTAIASFAAASAFLQAFVYGGSQ